jgi:hypothetical protein
MWTMMRQWGVAVAVFAVVLGGCDAIDTSTVEQEPVVEAYLVEGDLLPPVRLTRTAPIDAGPDGQAAIDDAEVVIEWVGGDGEPGAPVAYRSAGGGTYVPAEPVPVVEGGATYRLRATLPGGAPVRAETTVPTGLRLVEAVNTESTFQSPRQPSFTVTRATVQGAPVVFVYTTTSLLDFEGMTDEALRAELTPFYADGFDADEDDPEDLRTNPSPIVNQANYDDNGDGTITTDYPWIALAYYGRNEVGVSVLDRALYDYLRTQNAQQGGLSPGEIPNILDNVDGGTGIFGSYTQVTTTIDIARP